MFDHVAVSVGDYEASQAFYEAALAPLGLRAYPESQEAKVTGFGDGQTDFWIGDGGPPTRKLHIAFRAPDRATVDAFYAAAMAAGGRDNGPPGLRPRYHPNYYAGFVLDPDGNNVEAVCHTADPGDGGPENPQGDLPNRSLVAGD